MPCNSASCAPAQASLFTGYYPHTTGILKMMTGLVAGWRYFRTTDTIVQISARCTHGPSPLPAGSTKGMSWRTKIVSRRSRVHWWMGKFHEKWGHRQAEESCIAREKTTKFPSVHLPPAWKFSLDFFTGNRAVNWLTEYNEDKPFFLEIGFPGPHPLMIPPRIFRTIQGCRHPLQPVTQEDLDLQPQALKALKCTMQRSIMILSFINSSHRRSPVCVKGNTTLPMSPW